MAVSKQYQVANKLEWSFAAILFGFMIGILVVIAPVFEVWGTIWWVDAMAIAVLLLAFGAFALGGSIFLSQRTVKLEMDTEGLRLRNWRKSRFLPWTEVTAWCAVEVEDEGCLICLKTPTSREPLAIDRFLLDGRQFAKIYRDIQEHCGPPRPGADVLGDNEGIPFSDKRPSL